MVFIVKSSYHHSIIYFFYISITCLCIYVFLDHHISYFLVSVLWFLFFVNIHCVLSCSKYTTQLKKTNYFCNIYSCCTCWWQEWCKQSMPLNTGAGGDDFWKYYAAKVTNQATLKDVRTGRTSYVVHSIVFIDIHICLCVLSLYLLLSVALKVILMILLKFAKSPRVEFAVDAALTVQQE